MGTNDSSFIPKPKAWWDRQTLDMLLVFSRSVSNWIEENILNRISDRVWILPIWLFKTEKPLRMRIVLKYSRLTAARINR